MAQKVDLVSQYISSVLIPRLNRADNLYAQGRYVEAVDAQMRVIKTLYRETKEEKEKLVEWTKRFDVAMKKANKEKGHAEVFTAWKKIGARDSLAKNLYDDLEWEIWSYLHELGYFKPGKKYGPDLKDIDTKESVEL